MCAAHAFVEDRNAHDLARAVRLGAVLRALDEVDLNGLWFAIVLNLNDERVELVSGGLLFQ